MLNSALLLTSIWQQTNFVLSKLWLIATITVLCKLFSNNFQSLQHSEDYFYCGVFILPFNIRLHFSLSWALLYFFLDNNELQTSLLAIASSITSFPASLLPTILATLSRAFVSTAVKWIFFCAGVLEGERRSINHKHVTYACMCNSFSTYYMTTSLYNECMDDARPRLSILNAKLVVLWPEIFY